MQAVWRRIERTEVMPGEDFLPGKNIIKTKEGGGTKIS